MVGYKTNFRCSNILSFTGKNIAETIVFPVDSYIKWNKQANINMKGIPNKI